MGLIDKLKEDFTRRLSITGLSWILIASGGCETALQETTAAQYWVFYEINTEQEGVSIRSSDNSVIIDRVIGQTLVKLNPEEEINQGIVNFGKITISKLGYISQVVEAPPISLDRDVLFKDGIVKYKHPNIVKLEKDINYPGPKGDLANKFIVTFNSEPPGARLYLKGEYFGITPLTSGEGVLGTNAYKAAKLQIGPIVLAKEGYLPAKEMLELEIDPDLRYEHLRKVKYHNLTILKTDPDYKPPQQVVIQQPTSPTTQSHLTIKKEKDDTDIFEQNLGILHKIGEIGLMIKALRPIQ